MADFYTAGSDPADNSDLDSSVIRAEWTAIAAGFAKIAGYTGAANRVPHINSGATAMTSTSGFTFDGTTFTAPALAVTNASTFTGAATFNGAVTLGNAAADNITVTGTVTSNLIFTDATYDIGASGATRPRDLFLSRNAVIGSALTYGGVTLTAAVTGTGKMVLDTSPTLVTPLLGTPTSGTLTNCTGLPLTTGITGTLGAANGGTGVANNAASTLTISGSFATTLTITGITGVTLPTTGTLATLAGTEELDNKTLDSSVGKGTWTASGTWTLPAVTLGGAVTVPTGVTVTGAGTAAITGFTSVSATTGTFTNIGGFALTGGITSATNQAINIGSGALTVGAITASGKIAAGGSSILNYIGNIFQTDTTSGGGSTFLAGNQFNGSLTGASGDTSYITQVNISPSNTTTQTASESIGVVSSLRIAEPIITNNLTGGGVITTAATLYIASAPTEGAANYALYANGAALLGGNTTISGTTVSMTTSGTTLTVGVGADNGTVSAGVFTDRTKAFEGDAVGTLNLVKAKNGHIDHATLPAFARENVRKQTTDADGKVTETVEVERNIGAMVSILTVAAQELDARVRALEKK